MDTLADKIYQHVEKVDDKATGVMTVEESDAIIAAAVRQGLRINGVAVQKSAVDTFTRIYGVFDRTEVVRRFAGCLNA